MEKPTPVITDTQISALQYLIANTSEYPEIFRKTLIWLIYQSKKLTIPVSVTFEGFERHQIWGISDSTTVETFQTGFFPNYVCAMLKAMGSDFNFLDGSKPGNPRPWTIYLTKEFYDQTAQNTIITMENINKIRDIRLDFDPWR